MGGYNLTAIKKISSLIFCVIILLSALPAVFNAAENTEPLEYNSWEYSETNIPESLRYSDEDKNNGYGFYSGLYIAFNVNIKTSGFYKTSMVLGGEEAEGAQPALSLYVDSVLQTLKKSISNGGFTVPEENEFSELYLKEGSHTFKISANSGIIQFYKLTLTFNGVDDGKKAVELIYPVTDSIEKGGSDARLEANSEYTGIILGTSTSYAEHTVNVSAGNYSLSICYGANTAAGRMALSVNGGAESTYTLPQNNTWIIRSDFDRTNYYTIDLVSLNEGENTIKIRCEKAENGVDDAYFSYAQIKLTKIDSPEIRLYSGKTVSNDARIYALKKGDVTVLSYLPSYMKDMSVTFIAAIYKGDTLYKTATAQMENAAANSVLTAYLSDVELDDDEDYMCKFYHWNDFSGVVPLCEAEQFEKVYKNLYVAQDGSDEADGSKETPFKTLKRAKQEVASLNGNMQGDIVVNLAAGTYTLDETEVFTEEHGGKNGCRVIFRGENGVNKPILSGGTPVTGWTKYNDYIWKAPLETEADVRNLYVNGYMAQKARSKYRYMPTEDFTLEESENVNDGVAITAANFPESFARPSDLELCWQNSWTFQITPVKEVTKKDGMVYLTMEQPYYNMARTKRLKSTAPGAMRRFYLQNAMELLDEPGEFYYNKEEKLIYYYPFKNENLSDCETVVGTTDLLVSVAGKSRENKAKNIVFENISFKYGAWNEASETGVVVNQADKIVSEMNADEGNGGKMIPAQLDVKNAEGVIIKDCEFSCLGSSAIAMSDGVSNSQISGNKIHDISGSGIVIGHWDHNENHGEYSNFAGQCNNIDVLNNAIVRAAYEFKGCVGISVYYEKNINILNNYLKDLPYTGITLGWGWGEEADFGNIKVSYNRVENCVMPPVLDGGHIYTLGPLKNSEISYNYLTGTEGHYGAIYPDSGSSYLKIHHNVIEGCDHWFFGGLYETHDIEAYDNYSDTAVYYDYGSAEEFGVNYIEEVNLAENANWQPEAKSIINAAGLTSKYEGLKQGLSYPAWRTDFVKNSPNAVFKVKDATRTEAEDYNEGGQGVGYYKLRPSGSNTLYREGDVLLIELPDSGDIVITDTYPTEWLAYDVNIESDAKYEISVNGAYVKTFENELQPKVNIYVDDVLIAEKAVIQTTESWAINVDNIVGEYNLTKGKHTVKIEFCDNGFSFNSFRVVDVNKKNTPETTSPSYDEGVLVTEE